MKVEIIFMDAVKPKQVNVDDVYTKGGLLCLQYSSGLLVKYPLDRIFQVAYMHGKHQGSERTPALLPEGE